MSKERPCAEGFHEVEFPCGWMWNVEPTFITECRKCRCLIRLVNPRLEKPRPEVGYEPSPRNPSRGGDEEDNESSCERDPLERPEVERP